jgi:hypothetical protein
MGSTHHLYDFATSDVLAAFRRYIARRGVPLMIQTDNGTSFVRMAKDFQSLLTYRDALVTAIDIPPNIKLKFSAPAAPWQGGYFEQLVGLVKRALPQLAESKRVDDYVLRTLLCEAEAIVNSRPSATWMTVVC